MLAHPAMGLYSNASAVGKLLRQPEGRTKFDLKREVRSAGQGRMALRAGFYPPACETQTPKSQGQNRRFFRTNRRHPGFSLAKVVRSITCAHYPALRERRGNQPNFGSGGQAGQPRTMGSGSGKSGEFQDSNSQKVKRRWRTRNLPIVEKFGTKSRDNLVGQ